MEPGWGGLCKGWRAYSTGNEIRMQEGGTTVSIFLKNIPPGIRPEDNETGTRLTLEKLARYVE